MTEQLVNIARYAHNFFYLPPSYSYQPVSSEAKSLHNTLKELLKTKEPYDRDVDFQRKR